MHEKQPGSHFSLEGSVINPCFTGPGWFIPVLVSWCIIHRIMACNLTGASKISMAVLPTGIPDQPPSPGCSASLQVMGLHAKCSNINNGFASLFKTFKI